MLIQTFISRNNIHILQAENGAKAIEVMNNNDVDLIFMDSRMPVMNGIDAAKQIKHTHPSIPIIALTGESGDDEVMEITAIMDGYLTKPISKLKLLESLDQWL